MPTKGEWPRGLLAGILLINSMKKGIAAMAFALLFTWPASSQVSLRGVVMNDKGSTLPGATIQLDELERFTIADDVGEFHFEIPPMDQLTVTVRFVGYQLWSGKMAVTKNTEVVVRLTPSTLVSEMVIVKGTRAGSEDPVVYRQITRDDIQSTNRTQDIPYILKLTPSLVSTSDAGTGIGYTGLRIRGTDPSRINVTINGIPYNDSESHDVYWVDIPDFVSSVENIQVQRGVGTSTNGAGAFGANINIQTKSIAPQPYAELHTSGGSFNTLKNTISAGTGLIDNKFTFDFRKSDIRSDGYIDRAFARMNSLYLSGGYYSAKSVLTVTAFQGKQLSYQAWGGVPAELLEDNRRYNPYTYENEVDDYLQSHYQIHWSKELARALNLNLALHYTRGEGYYEQFKEDQDFTDYLLQPVITPNDTLFSTDLVRRKWLDNHFYGLIYNINYEADRLDVQIGGGLNRYDGDHYGRIVWAEHTSSSSPFDNYYYSRGLKTDFNVFGKVNYALTKKGLFLFGDMQYRLIDYSINGVDDDQRDLTQSHLYNFFNPKLGFVWQADPHWRVYTSLGVGNREPKRSNFTDAAPGVEIRPEQMTDLETGFTWKKDKGFVGFNLYFMDYTDQLVLTGEINDVGSAVMVNVADSYRAGIELEAGIQLTKRLNWEANATFSRNRILNFVEFIDDWDTWGQRKIEAGSTDLSFSPAIIAGSRVTWMPLKNLQIILDSKYVGSQYMDNTSSQEKMLDPYFVNDILIAYTPKVLKVDHLTVFGQVNNVFNHLYESNAWVYSYYYGNERNHMIGYYPQATRNFIVGLRLAL